MQFHLFHKLCGIIQLWVLHSKQVLVQSSRKQGKQSFMTFCNITRGLTNIVCQSLINWPLWRGGHYRDVAIVVNVWTVRQDSMEVAVSGGGSTVDILTDNFCWTIQKFQRNRHSCHGRCHSSSDGYGGQRVLQSW